MSNSFDDALKALIEWDEEEYRTFTEIEANRPRQLARYSENRVAEFNANLTKIAADYQVDAEKLRNALLDYKMDADTIGHVNGVAIVGFRPKF